MAGLVQCYRGLELVSGTDKLMFSAIDINFTVRYSIFLLLHAPVSAGTCLVFLNGYIAGRSSSLEQTRGNKRDAEM